MCAILVSIWMEAIIVERVTQLAEHVQDLESMIAPAVILQLSFLPILVVVLQI